MYCENDEEIISTKHLMAFDKNSSKTDKNMHENDTSVCPKFGNLGIFYAQTLILLGIKKINDYRYLNSLTNYDHF